MNIPHKPCPRCNGKKWFPSDIGNLACLTCNGTGEGEIDFEMLGLQIISLEEQLERSNQRNNITEAIKFGKGL